MLRQTHALCSLFNFQGYWSIHFRFESIHWLMINVDSSSLVNTSSCLFFSWGHYETLSMWRYFVLSYDQLKFLTSNERAGSLFPPLLIIPYIYLLLSSENLTVNTLSPNWSSLSFLLPVCLRISSNYTLRVAKALTVY